MKVKSSNVVVGMVACLVLLEGVGLYVGNSVIRDKKEGNPNVGISVEEDTMGYISIEDTNYAVPLSYEDLKENGYDLDFSCVSEKSLNPYESSSGYVDITKGGKKTKDRVLLANYSSSVKKLEDCEVQSIIINSNDFSLKGGVELGTPVEKVSSIFGEALVNREVDGARVLKYEDGVNGYVTVVDRDGLVGSLEYSLYDEECVKAKESKMSESLETENVESEEEIVGE